ncbi:MAG: VCBS repeat-containing protein, partial [Armatimonadetes bacterium]
MLTFLAGAAVATSLAFGQSRPLFEAAWRAYDVGDFPTFAPVAADYGDLDGDGDLDAVVAREYWWSPGISVLLNRGDGSFEQEVLYNVSQQMDLGDVAVRDFDLDGDLDALATVTGQSGSNSQVALWRNNGDGSFSSAQLFPAGPGPTGMTTADFNGDGFVDVLVANSGSNSTVALLLHNGQSGAQAGFLAPQRTTVGTNCNRVAAADLDGDGDVDAVVGRATITGGPDGINVLINDGTGSFSLGQSFTSVPGASRNSFAVVLADINGDGSPDLVSGGATGVGQVAIRLNNSGTFGNPTVYSLTEWSFTPWDIVVADFTQDGWLDIAAVTPSGRFIDGFNLLVNNGAGGYGAAIYRHSAKWPYSGDARDIDADGDLDLILVANDSSVLAVHENRGGQFPSLPSYFETDTLARVHLADLDRDGDLDVVAAGASGGRILRNQGSGSFTTQTFATPWTVTDMQLGDMNGDGAVDIVLRYYDFAVLLNDGSGGFGAPVVTRTGSSRPGEVGLFDLDSDGDLDVVATDPGPLSRVYLFRNLGNGTSFASEGYIADADGIPFGVDGADVDEDGDVDLMFSNALGMALYYGNNDFTFSPPEPTGIQGYPFRFGDVNGDGHTDIVYQQPQESFGTVFVGTMLGFGDGGFDRPIITAGPNGREGSFRITSDLDVYDVDLDGVQDVILTNNAPNDLSVFLGMGDGSLLAQDRYGAAYAASSSAFGDLNGDGLTDAAVVTRDGVVLLYGVQTSSIVTPTQFTVTRGAQTSGGLTDLFFSDDSYLNVEARRPTEVAAASVEIEVEGVSPTENPSTLKFVLEAGQSGTPVLQRIEL